MPVLHPAPFADVLQMQTDFAVQDAEFGHKSLFGRFVQVIGESVGELRLPFVQSEVEFAQGLFSETDAAGCVGGEQLPLFFECVDDVFVGCIDDVMFHADVVFKAL